MFCGWNPILKTQTNSIQKYMKICIMAEMFKCRLPGLAEGEKYT